MSRGSALWMIPSMAVLLLSSRYINLPGGGESHPSFECTEGLSGRKRRRRRRRKERARDGGDITFCFLAERGSRLTDGKSLQCLQIFDGGKFKFDFCAVEQCARINFDCRRLHTLCMHETLTVRSLHVVARFARPYLCISL